MKYQNIVNDNKVQCEICPRKCRLKKGQRGFCYVRKNIEGKITLETYGYNTGLAIDPVEKKPMYHFYPASNALSFGTYGCIMGCLFCQNSHITKVQMPIETCTKAAPDEIIRVAKKYNCKSIAFTYNDPVTFLEYAIDTAKLAKQENIKTIAVTSGYINSEAAVEFFSLMDGANIDLKGFSEEFYTKNCGAHLKPVLDTIEYAVNETNCFVELTTLIIEGLNDKDIEKECDWIVEKLGTDVPIHFSAFSPRYKFSDKLPTKYETLLKAYKIAKSKGINYVYTGNLSTTETSTTYCKHCKKPLIIRNGYKIVENNLEGDLCKFCKTKVDGRF